MFYMLWFYPTFVECYADCFKAISCPICLIHWTVLHRRVANDFNLWLATNLCNFCLYNLIMPATMISCPLPRIKHGTFDARYQSMLQSMHAQILLKSINKLSFSINPWSLGSFQIVVSSSFLYLAWVKESYWSLYIQCMLLINSDSDSMIYIVQTIDSWGVLHMSSIYYTWYILFILSIHDVCYICQQSMIHVIESWCLFNVIVINNPPSTPSPHNIHQQLTSVLHSGVSMLMNACGKYRWWFRNIPSLY